MKIYSAVALWLLTLPALAQSMPGMFDEKSSVDTTKRPKPNLHERGTITEIAVAKFTGGVNAPFTSSLGVNFCYIMPNDKRRRITEVTLGFDRLLGPPQNWYARLVSPPPVSKLNLSNGGSISGGVAVSRIIVNRHSAALTLGPELLIRMVRLPSLQTSPYTTVNYSNYILEPAAGIKARLCLGRSFTAQAEYIVGLKRKLKSGNELFPGSITTVPIDLSMVKVGIGFRI